MNLSKEMMFILRRTKPDDLKKLLSNSLIDQVPCYYMRYRGRNAGFDFYNKAVIDDIVDRLIYNYSTFDISEGEMESLYNIISIGLEKIFSNAIRNYYNSEDCSGYEE